MQDLTDTTALAEFPASLSPVSSPRTHDPRLNLETEVRMMRACGGPSFRVWRSTDSVVLGRFLVPADEVHMSRARELDIPVLFRPSGGGAVFHDLGNVNYSLYLPRDGAPSSIEESLRMLSSPVIELLRALGVDWTWEPPNNIYVHGAKISGSAQARSGDRVLHHGTLLVSTDLKKMRHVLKPGGRSAMAPVVNLEDVVSGVSVETVEELLVTILSAWRPLSLSS